MNWQKYSEWPESHRIYTVEVGIADPANPTADRETLYFSSGSIDPGLTEIYHEPCIKNLPNFARSLQSLSYGGTSATYGSVVLLIGDGHLDAIIANRILAGAPVVIRLGFDGLNQSEFKEIFTGHVSGDPKNTDTQLTLPLVDGVGKFLNHKLSEQTLSGALPTVLDTLLTSAELPADKRDSAMWDAWKANNNFQVWMQVSKNQTLATVLDSLLAPLACWYDFGRDGLFRISTFGLAAADATAKIFLTDIELTKNGGEKSSVNHAWKVVVSYFSATGDLPETAEVSWEESAIKTLNGSATEISKTTMLTSSTDAKTIRDRWKALFSVQRKVAIYTACVQLFQLQLGDVVRVTRDRFELDDLFVVQKITENMGAGSVSLELFR